MEVIHVCLAVELGEEKVTVRVELTQSFRSNCITGRYESQRENNKTKVANHLLRVQDLYRGCSAALTGDSPFQFFRIAGKREKVIEKFCHFLAGFLADAVIHESSVDS